MIKMEENKYEKDKAFIEDFHALIQKHGLTVLTGSQEAVRKAANGLEGNFMFITRGEKSIELRGGESIEFQKSLKMVMKSDFIFSVNRGYGKGELAKIHINKSKAKPEE
jgi:hypothetical protein